MYILQMELRRNVPAERRFTSQWFHLREGSRVNEVALFMFNPANKLAIEGNRRWYVNVRPLVDRFGSKKVNHSIKQLNARYGTRISKPFNKRFQRDYVWQVGNPTVLEFTAQERARLRREQLHDFQAG